MNRSTTTIHHLPPEMLCEIFKHLDLEELLKKRSVCKLWNSLIGSMKVERLNVDLTYRSHKDWGAAWYETRRPQLERDICDPELLMALCKKPILSNIKYLKINDPPQVSFEFMGFDFNDLNAFQQLVQLDLRTNDQHLTLNLPNLQIFSLMKSNDEYSLKLNCPKLRVLRYYEPRAANKLVIENSDTIRSLDTSMFGAKLTRFKNVEILRCASPDPAFLDESIFKLKKLKTLHLNVPLARAANEYVPPSLFDMVKGLEEFMKAKQRANRSDLEVYFAGVRMAKNDLSDIEANLGVRIGNDRILPEELYLKHYDRLQDDLDFVWRVDYNRLLALKNPLPTDYFDRFWDLKEVKIIGPVDEQHVLGFFQKARSLRTFDLHGPLFSQSFFDRLPDVCSPTILTLHECDEEKNAIQLNFAFIGKLVRLTWIEFRRDLSWDSVKSLIPELQFIAHHWDCYLYFTFRGVDLTMDWSNTDEAKPNRFCLGASKFKLALKDRRLDQILRYLQNPKHFENLTPLE